MKNIYTVVCSLIFSLTFTSAFSQLSFTNKTDLLQNQMVTSGVAVAVADLNNDGLDDIVRMDNATNLKIEYQTADGQIFDSFGFGTVSNSRQWSICVADVNNDGLNDILTGGSYDGVRIYTNISDSLGFMTQTLPGGNIFLQGSNFADINNDGWVDAFGCHDDGESRIWQNDGTGVFVSADNWIDMVTTPASDNSGNYGSIWSDFDNDRDLDLYIAKCRIGVGNPEDPRRINALFSNDGQNNYSETADYYGLKVQYQSWTADFNDIDNDGDMDCFLTNHDHPTQLLENDGAGHFTDISASAGIQVSGDFKQGVMRDFNNDGWIDLISADPTRIFLNNGDKTFTLHGGNDLFENTSLNTFAIGDLNDDGSLDIYNAYQTGYNNPSNTPDRIWMNDGNDNNYLKVRLEGSISNSQGVGARIEIHGDWGIQVREVRSGESYGIMNSLMKHFGLGTSTSIDQIVVKWPSGNVDLILNPEINQTLTIVENSSCQLDPIELTINGPSVLCPGVTTEVSAPDGYSYLWSNGSTEQSISLENAANLSVVVFDAEGCVAISNAAIIEYAPDETPTITALGPTSFCAGENVILSSTDANSYTWSTGSTDQEIVVSEPGDYEVTIEGDCGQWTSNIISVEVIETTPPIVENDTIFAPGTAELLATGDFPQWYETMDATEAIGMGNVFITPSIDMTTTYFVEDFVGFSGGAMDAGMPEHLGSNYSGAQFNGQVLFNAEVAFVLESVTTHTDSPGQRIIELRDASDEVLQSVTIDMAAGDNIELVLNFDVPAGEGYRLTTNTQNNNDILGFNSPRLKRSDEDVNYPYEIPGVISVYDSNFGSGFYYYFFDWKINASSDYCVSDRVPAVAHLNTNNVNELDKFEIFKVAPNPSNGLFNLSIQSLETENAELSIFDLTGKVVKAEQVELINNNVQNMELNISYLPKGVYFLQIQSDTQFGKLKVVVQ